MLKALTIAKWEFLERIKRKSFIFSMIVMPLLIVTFSLLPSMLISDIKDSPMPLGLVDFTNQYKKDFSNELSKFILPDGQPTFLILNFSNNGTDKESILSFADKQVLNNGVNGYVIIEKNKGLHLTFRTNGLYGTEKIGLIEKTFNKILAKRELINAGLNTSEIDKVFNNFVTLQKEYIEGKDENDILKSFITSYLFIILLITMVLFSGGMFVRSLVLEKSNRIMEIILSSCTSKQLLLGKVLGLSVFGLFQFLIWFLLGIFLYKTNTFDFSLIKNIEYQILFFVVGYIFYSSIFIGLGSIVTADSEAQQLTGFLSIFLISPILFAFQIISSPNSILALVLSYFPLTAAPAMLLRLNSTNPSVMEIISVISVLVFSLYLVVLVSSKLFRVGLLNTGKKPTLKEIYAWLKLK